MQDMYAGSPGQNYNTPARQSAAAYDQSAANRMDALSAFSAPASVLETAGKQDEVGIHKQRQKRCAMRSSMCIKAAAGMFNTHTERLYMLVLWLKNSPEQQLCCVLQVIRMKGALNEKEMELIELREQHMQLVVSIKQAVNARDDQGTLCRPDLSEALASSSPQPCAGTVCPLHSPSSQKPLLH
jgi:hypothetical protein